MEYSQNPNLISRQWSTLSVSPTTDVTIVCVIKHVVILWQTRSSDVMSGHIYWA